MGGTYFEKMVFKIKYSVYKNKKLSCHMDKIVFLGVNIMSIISTPSSLVGISARSNFINDYITSRRSNAIKIFKKHIFFKNKL